MAERLAFPSAEGDGRYAYGGRGGQSIAVTNLNDAGTGSLRAALQTAGPRYVWFRVSGTIVLKTKLVVNSGFLYLAAHTSPGGIQLRGTPGTPTGISFGSGCSDIIVRGLRVRIGGKEVTDNGESLLIHPGSPVADCIFDHCSVQWGHDGQVMAYNNWDRITFQWCIIAEAIDSSDGQGREGMHIGGAIDMNAGATISVIKNLFAHNEQRNPNMTRARRFLYANNLCYNWMFVNGPLFGRSGFNWSAFGNIESNRYKTGPDSSTTQRCYAVNNTGEYGGTKVYTDGKNWGPKQPGGGADDWIEFRDTSSNDNQASASQYRTMTRYPTPPITLWNTAEVETRLLDTVGANVPSRDSVDTRIVAEVRNRTGQVPTHAGGPWPDLATGAPAPPQDSNMDGIPDAVAINLGYGVNDTIMNLYAPNGYTNLENYFNKLAGDDVGDDGTGGEVDPPPVATGDPELVGISALVETASGSALAPTRTVTEAGHTLIYWATSRLVGNTPSLGTPTDYTEIFETGTNNNTRCAMGIRYNVPVGTHTPSISMLAGARGSALLFEYKNIKDQGLRDFSQVNVNNLTTCTTGLVTPPNVKALLLGVCTHSGTQTTINPPTSPWEQQREDETVDVGLPHNVVHRLAPSTSDVDVTWTLAVAKFGHAMMVALEADFVETTTADKIVNPSATAMNFLVPTPSVAMAPVEVPPGEEEQAGLLFTIIRRRRRL